MDFSNFNNDLDSSDTNYLAFVEWLSERTAAELREAKGNIERQKRSLCHYYKRGLRANLTVGELIDFLGVSTPSVLDRAGYDEEEADALMVISDSLTDEEIESASLHPDAQ